MLSAYVKCYVIKAPFDIECIEEFHLEHRCRPIFVSYLRN